MAIQLDDIIPWGRSFEEYRGLFALSDDDLAGQILGCGDGPASFNAEATARGHVVVSCDPIYALSGAEIEQRVQACHADLIAQVRLNRDAFVWDYFRDPEDLGRCRLAAMQRFLDDFGGGRAAGRYVAASLPHLPFAANRFDLALVSHFLFLYSDRLACDFHRLAIEELLRVADEVRIFPLLTLEGKRSPHLEPIRGYLVQKRWKAEVIAVPYEFQRGGKEMLRIAGEHR
jgi:hypothetical protein